MRRSLSLIAVLMLAGWGCGGDSKDKPTGPGGSEEPAHIKAKTPEEARRELGALAIQYTEEAFVTSMKNDDTLAVKLFIEAGMMNLTEEVDTEEVLRWAARTGGVGIVRLLLDRGTNVNAQDYDGRTALMEAAEEGHTEVVRALLAAGADVNAKDEYDRNALVFVGSPEIGRMLLDAGGEVPNEYGRTTLMYAAYVSHAEMVRKLLADGADVNAKDDAGRTALMFAAMAFGPEAGTFGLETVAVLLDKGADVNAKDEYGSTALMSAVEDYRRIGIVRALIKAGADVNAGDNYGNTALMQAASTGYIEIAELLIKAGADVNAQATGGRTALMEAERAEDYVKEETKIKMIQMLKDAGATG